LYCDFICRRLTILGQHIIIIIIIIIVIVIVISLIVIAEFPVGQLAESGYWREQFQAAYIETVSCPCNTCF